MKLTTRTSRSISLIVTAALIYFAYIYISSLVTEADFGGVRVNWLLLLLAVLLFVINYFWMSLNWLYSAQSMRSSVSNRQALVFLASQPYKYLPTSLFIFSSRAIYGKKLGLTIKQASLAQLPENLSLFISNFILFVIFLAARDSLFSTLVIIAILFGGVLLLKRRSIITIAFRKKKLEMSTNQFIKQCAFTMLGWIFIGLSFVCLNMAFGLQFDFMNILAANTIAFSLSMLAVFAPVGIGVREAIYGVFSVSAVAVIYWRIMVFVMDMLLGVSAIVAISLARHSD